ncbi:nuclear envelope integral membrane protein 1 isoform X2 [Orussus abietinus]|uniref:nuclear envelope integral membrane protein 1 isoform X2 n=1 Tax=Orussus abietinus TaxID=222816 RepID=UPI00062633EC|nr:nuclear envelope integral membrane protein 1 isoform X2 [Orussus abietinus]
MKGTVLSAGCLITLFMLYPSIYSELIDSRKSIHFLEPGETKEILMRGTSSFDIFCHRKKPKHIFHIWRTIMIHLSNNLDNYEVFDGKSPVEVKEKYEEDQRSWRFNIFSAKKIRNMRLNPFEETCIGIFTPAYNNVAYQVSMTLTPIDVWKVIAMVTGIITFWCARRLSHNPLFYYMSGMLLGITMSTLIIIYLISKLLPRGKFMYVMVATGWTMSLYVAQALWENAQLIAVQYRDWVMWYILITSFISFIICYRFGPVTNKRTKQIIQWFLQASSLVMIYYSSHFHEASVSCCVLILLMYNFPIVLIHSGKRYWRIMFPEKRKLLTEDQYQVEGIVETKKALSHLREHCSSPDCNQWKTILRLKDPIRL